MHYAKRLKDESLEWRKRIKETQDIKNEFRNYLTTHPKFKGPCEDYISTHEVLAYLQRISDALNGVDE